MTASPMGSTHETPFDSIENAQDYLRLLLEAVADARSDIAADTAEAEQAALARRLDALRLVEFKMEKLDQRLRGASRLLNDLRTLRRLLLEERSSPPE
jgi:primosomal protein N''